MDGPKQPKILGPAPGGYLVDYGDGVGRLTPESALVEQGLVQGTPGMYEQQAQFGGSRQAPQAALDEAAAYTDQMHQQYPGSAGAMPAQGPTPLVSGAPVGGARPPMDIPMPFGQTYRFDVDQGSGQPLGDEPDVPGAPDEREVPSNYSSSMGQSASYSGIPSIDAPPELPDLSGYGQELRNADKARTAASQKQQAALNEQAGLLDQRNAALAPLQAQIPADVAHQQQVMQAFDEVVNEHIQQENDRISQRMAAVPQENPGRIWSDMPAWQGALGLLSAVTGGMLAVTTGSGKNMGLEAIERAIQRDVEAQRTNIDSEWKKVAHDEQSLQAYQQWKSKERVNMLEEGMLRREALKFQLESEANKYDNLSKKAELHGTAAGLEAKNQEDHAAIVQQLFNNAKAEADQLHKQYIEEQTLKQTSVKYGIDAAAAQAKADKEAANLPVYTYKNGDRVYLNPEYKASNRPEDFSKLKEALQKKDMFLSEWDDLIADVSEMGRSNLAAKGKVFFSDADKLAIQSRYDMLALDYVNEKAATTFTDRLVGLVQDAMGGPQGLTDVSKVPSMLAFKEATYKKLEAPLRGQEAYIVGRDGKQRPYDGDARYGASPVTTGDKRQITQQVRDAVVGLSSDDPNEVLSGLHGLTSYSDADLQFVRENLIQHFSQMETESFNGRTVVRFPGDPGYKGGKNPDNSGTATTMMRLFTGQAAMKAKAAGDEVTAQAIDEAAGQLDMFLNTGKRVPTKAAPLTTVPGSLPTQPNGVEF